MAEYRLEMRGVSKSFPGVKALDQVNLKVRPGTVHALMGENGAGKSTLMKCLFGIYHMDEGEIYLDGEKVSIANPDEALQKGLAMVHQELQPIPERTVAENMYTGRYPMKRFGPIMWFVYNYTRHGKYMYAIGGNEAAAEVAGVNVKRTKIKIYVTAATLYAIAGFLLGAKSGGASVNMGMGYELEAIAACTIGGVSVNGGIGRVSGVVVGVLVFELLKTCLQFLGIDPNYQYIAQGIVIVVAIALDIRKYIAKK